MGRSRTRIAPSVVLILLALTPLVPGTTSQGCGETVLIPAGTFLMGISHPYPNDEGLLQITLWRSRICSEVSRQLHPPHCHLQPPHDLCRPGPRHLPLKRLGQWQQETYPDDLSNGVLTPLPAACSPPRLCPHSQQWIPVQSPASSGFIPLFRLIGSGIPADSGHRSRPVAASVMDLSSLRWPDGSCRTAHAGTDLLALTALPRSLPGAMKNLFSTRHHQLVSAADWSSNGMVADIVNSKRLTGYTPFCFVARTKSGRTVVIKNIAGVRFSSPQ